MARRSRLLPVPLLAALVLAGACSAGGGSPVVQEEPLATTSTTVATGTASTTTTTTAAEPTTTTASVDPFRLRPPAPPAHPASLAAMIVASERAIRDPATAEVALAEAALAQQLAYRVLGAHPEWDAAVLAAVPADLHATVQRHAAARRELRAMHTKPPTVMPAWEIVPPVPVEELVGAYRAAETEFGIPWPVLAAINLVETGLGRIRGTSVAGAQGPMQFMPATWEAYGAGGDVDDLHDAVMAAGRYLAANNGTADLDHALYRYNHSHHYVRAVRTYAELIAEHPRAFLGFYHWGIWYVTDHGEQYLPVGYHETAPVAVSEYLAR